MSRSNAPLALSVVNLTVPGDPEATLRNITQFDDEDFGFNHNQTWNAMPYALQGQLEPEAVLASFKKVPVRVQRCVTSLCAFGRNHPSKTFNFKDYPNAGLKTTSSIAWDPEVRVRVKGACWYISDGKIVIPMLQPRKRAFSLEQLGVYTRLARQAYCQGDWVEAIIRIFDLSGDALIPEVSVIDESMTPIVSDVVLATWIKTYVEAKRAADKIRAERPKPEVVTPMDDLFNLPR